MKEIRGNEKARVIIEEFPQSEKIFADLGIDLAVNGIDKSLVELAIKSRVPLQVLMNNLAKNLGLKVRWPEIKGIGNNYQDDFANSTGLRKGKPVGIDKIVAVHSGKGGVGKTTIAITLAYQLAKEGRKVGLLDLDIDCPNIVKSLSLTDRHVANESKKIKPLDYKGIKVVSMGAIQERDDLAIMWRGPILAKAIEQLFFDSEWGELDVLVVDFPPGTSEAPLTFFNLIKPDGVVIIATPQNTALYDAAKSADMCRSLGINIYGVVENMTGKIFGESDDKKTIKITGEKWLGKISLDKSVARDKFWEKKLNKDLKILLARLEKLIFS